MNIDWYASYYQSDHCVGYADRKHPGIEYEAFQLTIDDRHFYIILQMPNDRITCSHLRTEVSSIVGMYSRLSNQMKDQGFNYLMYGAATL